MTGTYSALFQELQYKEFLSDLKTNFWGPKINWTKMLGPAFFWNKN